MPLPKTHDEVWQVIERWPFAVLGFVTPEAEARAAGVMYVVEDRKLYVLTGPDTWKVRHIRRNPHVSVTVTVTRLPIRVRQAPPAVITFSGVARVARLSELSAGLQRRLLRGVTEMAATSCVIVIDPVGRFVTYGIGVPPWQMRNPANALARVPIEASVSRG